MWGANYREIFRAFADEPPLSIEPIGSGNINDTLKVVVAGSSYLLQRINHQVFTNPAQVQKNYELIYAHLVGQGLPLHLPALIRTKAGAAFTTDSGGNVWRLLEFIEGGIAYEQAQSLEQVAEAAAKIGQFVAALNRLPVPDIRATIGDFHNFQKRYRTFTEVVKRADGQRVAAAASAIAFIREYATQIPDYRGVGLPLRMVHNDPKVGNVLFASDGKVLAVIDWDTVMPGYLATDLGDMIRTMAVTADEDERDISRVDLRSDYLQACLEHFLHPLREVISPLEKACLATGPLYIAMEQALRFLQDYLAGDVYYKTQYPGHNLDRSQNQIALCSAILREQDFITQEIDRILA